MQQCHGDSGHDVLADADASEVRLRRQLVEEVRLIVETSKVPPACGAFVLARLDAALAALTPLATVLITQQPPLGAVAASIEHRRFTAGLLCELVNVLAELWFLTAPRGSDEA